MNLDKQTGKQKPEYVPIALRRVRRVPPFVVRCLELEKENPQTIVMVTFATGYHAYGWSAEWLKANHPYVAMKKDKFNGGEFADVISIQGLNEKIKSSGLGLIRIDPMGKLKERIPAEVVITVKKPEPLAIPQKVAGSAIVPKNFWSTHILPKTENKIDVPTDFDESEAVELPIQSAIFDGVVYTSGQAYTKSGKLKKGFKPLADMEIVENVDFSTFKIPSRSCAVVHDVIEQPALPPAFNPGGWYMPAPPQKGVEESQQKVVDNRLFVGAVFELPMSNKTQFTLREDLGDGTWRCDVSYAQGELHEGVIKSADSILETLKPLSKFKIHQKVKIEGLCQEGVICGFSGEWWKVSYSIGSHPMVAWRKFNDIQEVE